MKLSFCLKTLPAFLFIQFLCIADNVFAQSSNCTLASSATALDPSTTCSTIQGDLQAAISDATTPAGNCGGATTTSTNAVWFRFTAETSTQIISVPTTSLGSFLSATTTYIEALQGTCGSSMISLACQPVSDGNLALTGLSVGTQYFIRVYVIGSTTSGAQSNRRRFTICIQNTPTSDVCTNPTTLTSSSTCTNLTGTLAGATSSSPAVASTCAGTPGGDVWYSFVAQTAYPTISLSGRGSNFGTGYIQLLSGACGGFTSLACVTGTTATLTIPTNTIAGGAGLTPGNTYYLRVYTATASPTGSGWDFNICVQNPSNPTNIEYSRSYINITRGNTGGTVQPGDTLEMRAVFVVRSGTSIDSLAYFDTLFNTRGLRLVPGSIALRTNEGKLYQSFTDTYDADAGWYQPAGLDTIIQINFGTGATSTVRGLLTSGSLPSVFGSTCIVMATYRVVVYAGYNSTINFKTGSLTFRSTTDGVLYKRTFTPNNLIVYESPGLCPNSVSPSNALGAEFNGTFGAPSGSLPHVRNRGTSPYTTYTYRPFGTGTGPGDTEYGIANNTSATYTTTTTWPKSDPNGYRLFGLWDITGDHTNSTNQTAGNLPCDINQPISPSNPCGYMLVVNASFKTDTAFTYTVSGLCPNTYYEIAAWFKNICYKCGCDVNGVPATNAGYIPTAPGDSSGVRPNIAFDVNGIDYYTTGDILYYGTTPTGSDASNRWVKRGFTYLTGPAQTSFTLTLRNNAPGGGGNDWAMDDIAVATCSPNLSFTPSNNPPSCSGNNLEIRGTVNSYFSNYVNYKWQRRPDSSSAWVDVSTAATGTPVLNSGQYTYAVDFNTGTLTTSNTGVQFRLVTATTTGNLSTASCSLDGSQGVTVTVNNCAPVLGTNIISFVAKQENNRSFLRWTTDKENEAIEFIIERSTDGLQFSEAGTVSSQKNYANELNTYAWAEPDVEGKVYYRIKMTGKTNWEKYSKTLTLGDIHKAIESIKAVNPFSTELAATIQVANATIATVQLVNQLGIPVRTQRTTLEAGRNTVMVNDVKLLSTGFYTLRIIADETILTQKLLKQ